LLGAVLGRDDVQGHVALSSIEHASVSGAARLLSRGGCQLTFIPVNDQGIITPQAVREALRPNTVVVSVMHANHETGVIQPIRPIAEICRDAHVLLHTDASQTVGRVRVNVEELEVDLLTLSGHKIYAPKGVGALYVRAGTKLEPLQCGDGQENGLRSGTENMLGIVGMGTACELASRSLDEALLRLEQLRDRFEARLRTGVGAQLVIHGQRSPRLPNTSCVAFPGVQAADMLARAPELCLSTASTGYATAGGVSPILSAMGVSPEVAQGTLRMSAGWQTTEEEIDRAADLLLEAWEALR
jgi:cysteine desulfurase